MFFLREGKNITITYDEDISTVSVMQGYVFLTSNGECVCEFIYYFNDLSLEIFDLSEGKTSFYINTFIFDIEEIFEREFYWG